MDGPHRDSSPQPTFTTLPRTPPPSVNPDDRATSVSSLASLLSASGSPAQPLIPQPTYLHPHHSPTASLAAFPRHHLTPSLTLLSLPLPSYSSRPALPAHVKSDSGDSLTQRLAASMAAERSAAEDKLPDSDDSAMLRLISAPITKNEMQLRAAAESLTTAAAAAAVTLSSGSSRLVQKDTKSPSPPPASTPSPFLLSAHSPTPSLSSASSLLSTSPTLSPLYLTSAALLSASATASNTISTSPPLSAFHSHSHSLALHFPPLLLGGPAAAGGSQLLAPRPRVALSGGVSTVSALEAADEANGDDAEDEDERAMKTEQAEAEASASAEERDSDAASFLSFLASSPPPAVPLHGQHLLSGAPSSPPSAFTIAQDSLRLRAAASPSLIHTSVQQPQLFPLRQWPVALRPLAPPTESPPPQRCSQTPGLSPILPHTHTRSLPLPLSSQPLPVGPYRLSAQPPALPPAASHSHGSSSHRFHCNNCGKPFPSNSALSMHLLVHTNSQPRPSFVLVQSRQVRELCTTLEHSGSSSRQPF